MKEDSIFINRELSWLDFNRRVLVLGKDKNVPLAEQLKFLAIYGSNLDEFFMVRVGSLQERASLMRAKKERDKRENKTNMTAEEQLAAIMPKTAHLQEDCDKYYEKALENLAACGYKKVDFDALSKEEEHFWKKYFQSELFPILSPQIVDSRHPFPFLRNKEICLGVLLKEKEGQSLGMIPISSQMERLQLVRRDGHTEFALTEELVLHYAALIFGKDAVQEKCLFRVTRNADIDVKEGMMDHDIDYREIMADLLKRRRKLAAVRLQVTPTAPQEIVRILCGKLELTHKRQNGGRRPPGAVLPLGPAHAAAAGVRPCRRGAEARCAAQLSVPVHPAFYCDAEKGRAGPGRHLHQDDPVPDGAGVPDRTGPDGSSRKWQGSCGAGGAARPL